MRAAETDRPDRAPGSRRARHLRIADTGPGPAPGCEAMPVRVNGFPGRVVVWTAECYARLADPPPARLMCGVFVTLGID